jgi:hypothetical protein
MIKSKKTPPAVNRQSEAEIEQARKDIKAALDFKIGDCGEFSTTNIKSWRAMLYRSADGTDIKFQIKQIKEKEGWYNIWRVQ